MKQLVFFLTTLFFLTCNCHFLRKISEDLHNVVNSVIPHEHHFLPLGKHHHHHNHEEDFHHPDSREHLHDFSGPSHQQYPSDCNSQEQPPVNDKTENLETDSTNVVFIETTTVAQRVDSTPVFKSDEEEGEGSWEKSLRNCECLCCFSFHFYGY